MEIKYTPKQQQVKEKNHKGNQKVLEMNETKNTTY